MGNAFLTGKSSGNSSNGISQTDADNRYLRLTGGTLSDTLQIIKTDVPSSSSTNYDPLLFLQTNQFPNNGASLWSITKTGNILFLPNNKLTMAPSFHYDINNKLIKLRNYSSTDYDSLISNIDINYGINDPTIQFKSTTTGNEFKVSSDGWKLTRPMSATSSSDVSLFIDGRPYLRFLADSTNEQGMFTLINYEEIIQQGASGFYTQIQSDGITLRDNDNYLIENPTTIRFRQSVSGRYIDDGGTIKGLKDPTDDKDAANKAYVDNAVSNLSLTELNTVVSPRMGGDAISIVDLDNEVIDISNSDNPVIYFQYQNSALSEYLNNSIEHILSNYEIYLDLDSAPIEKYPLYKLPEPIYSTQDSSSTAIYYSSGAITLETEGNSCATFVVFAGKITKTSEGSPYNRLIFINLNLEL